MCVIFWAQKTRLFLSAITTKTGVAVIGKKWRYVFMPAKHTIPAYTVQLRALFLRVHVCGSVATWTAVCNEAETCGCRLRLALQYCHHCLASQACAAWTVRRVVVHTTRLSHNLQTIDLHCHCMRYLQQWVLCSTILFILYPCHRHNNVSYLVWFSAGCRFKNCKSQKVWIW